MDVGPGWPTLSGPHGAPLLTSSGVELTREVDEIQDFLIDASHMHSGHAERVVLPENATEIAEVLAKASANQTPVTVSGAGTGTVGGRVPFGGIVLATDRLNRIKSIVHLNGSGRATTEAGARHWREGESRAR